MKMRYFAAIFIIIFIFILGCIDSSPYEEATLSQLITTPNIYEGKKICTDLIFEKGGFSGIEVVRNQNFSSDMKNGSLERVCGIYGSGRIEPESISTILAVSTEKEVYYSNDTLKVHVDFYSENDGKARLEISGIKNDFGRALVSNVSDISLSKGLNKFDLEFKTPSCEECSGLTPGEYLINASVIANDDTFEVYKKITLQSSNYSIHNSNNTEKNDRLSSMPNETVSVTETLINRSNDSVLIEYFYLPGCQKCEQATPVVEAVVKSYGDKVIFLKYNAREEGRDLALQYGIPGTPSIVINKDSKNLISYDNYNGDTAKLEKILREDIENTTQNAAANSGNRIILSIPSVFMVGLVAGFNPCLLAILAFIASVTLATTGRRRNVILIVLMFSLGIFMTYLIVGIGLLRILEESPALQAGIKNFLIILIGILGIWHVYDAYHLTRNKESSFYTPKSFIRITESVTKKVSLPASFFMGALFSLIKAPCVGAVYFLILDMVRSGKTAGYLYLASYNFGVVLPVLVLGGSIALGLDPERVEKFRKDKRSAMRLVTGITLLLVAVLMYAGLI